MKPTTLTKSRFIQAIECPRKLVYATDHRYHNARKDDDILEALALGGHQVGALAKLMHQEGIEISAHSVDEQLTETNKLVERENVILFEPTFRHNNLVVRVDVLIKNGNNIQLIEVKSKSAGRSLDAFGKRGHPIKSKWRPYIYDVAFQKYVLECVHPEWSITPYLMVPDTSVIASVHGVSSQLAVEKCGRNVTVHVATNFDPISISPPLLRKHDVSEEVGTIMHHPVVSPAEGHEFVPFVKWVSSEIHAGNDLPPFPGNQCKRCEFYCAPEMVTDNRLSGWNECMKTAIGAGETLARTDSVFGLWNFRSAGDLLSASTLALCKLEKKHIRDQGGGQQDYDFATKLAAGRGSKRSR